MKLDTAFCRLPLRFDAARLHEEVQQFGVAEWRPHPQGFRGNSAVVLVSAHGGVNDAMHGPMLPTDCLRRTPYIRQVLAAFDTVVGRSRLMRLDGGERVVPHVDVHYYWHDRVRVHVPIVTDPAVRFDCGGHEVHMAAGEAWLLDTWRVHGVVNGSSVRRVHLVFDTVGSAAFWDLVSRGDAPFGRTDRPAIEPRTVPWDPHADGSFVTERYNLPVVMPPGELDALLADAIADAAAADATGHADLLTGVRAAARRGTSEWRALWAAHGPEPDGWPAFRTLQQQLGAEFAALPDDVALASNGQPLARILRVRLAAALNTAPVGDAPARPAVPSAMATAAASSAGRSHPSEREVPR